MHFSPTAIEGAWLIDPTPHEDSRGRFMRAWCFAEFNAHNIDFVPLQANMGFSAAKGTVRGVHFQTEPAIEMKLVRCTRGRLFDVVVDLRPDSPTFADWFGAELTAENGRMLLIPENCGHACQSLEADTEFYYMTSAPYAPASARGVRFDDPAIGIRWPVPVTSVSDQDRNWPGLDLTFRTRFPADCPAAGMAALAANSSEPEGGPS